MGRRIKMFIRGCCRRGNIFDFVPVAGECLTDGIENITDENGECLTS